MAAKRYTLISTVVEYANKTNRIVIGASSHRVSNKLRTSVIGIKWECPLSLGSKSHLYTADNTVENRALVLRAGGKLYKTEVKA